MCTNLFKHIINDIVCGTAFDQMKDKTEVKCVQNLFKHIINDIVCGTAFDQMKDKTEVKCVQICLNT